MLGFQWRGGLGVEGQNESFYILQGQGPGCPQGLVLNKQSAPGWGMHLVGEGGGENTNEGNAIQGSSMPGLFPWICIQEQYKQRRVCI